MPSQYQSEEGKESLSRTTLDQSKILWPITLENTSTARWFKAKLADEYKELKHLSTESVRRSLKTDWKLSYKKAYRIAPRATAPESIRYLWETAALLHFIDSEGVELVYLDEFSLSSRQFAYKNWSK